MTDSRLVIVPVTVTEEEPFPDTLETPLVDPNVNLPSLTVSVSVSALLPALASDSVMASAPVNASARLLLS